MKYDWRLITSSDNVNKLMILLDLWMFLSLIKVLKFWPIIQSNPWHFKLEFLHQVSNDLRRIFHLWSKIVCWINFEVTSYTSTPLTSHLSIWPWKFKEYVSNMCSCIPLLTWRMNWLIREFVWSKKPYK